MQIDVATLYYLIVGTACIGALLTAWQRRFDPAHRRELGFWTAGQFLIGLGCLARIFHPQLPHFVAIGLSNLAVLFGYAAIAVGAMLFAGERIPRSFVVAVACSALAWLAWGQYAPLDTRIIYTAVVTFAFSVRAALALRQDDEASPLVSQRLVQAMLLIHGLFFLGRAGLTASGIEGDILFTGANFAITMMEGVLWSAFLPSGLLSMVRERTERKLVAVSETDFLTGVDNRRVFIGKANRLLVEDGATPATVAVFDLDHFKSINDRYGHALGDEVLRVFCRVAVSELAPGDIFGRLGGEEFAAVFHSCDGPQARQIADAISKRYTAEVELRFSLSLRATVSAGLTESRPEVELAQLLGEADGALYQAKKNGRDQAVMADMRPSSAWSAKRAA